MQQARGLLSEGDERGMELTSLAWHPAGVASLRAARAPPPKRWAVLKRWARRVRLKAWLIGAIVFVLMYLFISLVISDWRKMSARNKQ